MNYTACSRDGTMVVAQVPDGEYSHACEACACSPKDRQCGDDMNPVTGFHACDKIPSCDCGNMSNGGAGSSYELGQKGFAICCAQQNKDDPVWKQCSNAAECCKKGCQVGIKGVKPVDASQCMDACDMMQHDSCTSGCFNQPSPPPSPTPDPGPSPSPYPSPSPSPGPGPSPSPSPSPSFRSSSLKKKQFGEQTGGKVLGTILAVGLPFLIAALVLAAMKRKGK